MKSLLDFINESLIQESQWDELEAARLKLEKADGFSTKIKASDKPADLFLLKFDKKTGDVIKSITVKNDLDEIERRTKRAAEEAPYRDKSKPATEFYVYANVDEQGIACLWIIMNSDHRKSSIIFSNTVKEGLVIGYYDDANTEVIKKFVKENIKLFATTKEYAGLTDEEYKTLDKFFDGYVKEYESVINTSTKSYTVYFPSKEKAKESVEGWIDTPRIVISRPSGYRGGVKVTIFKRYNTNGIEWPRYNSKDMMKHTTVDSIIPYLMEALPKYADKIGGIEFK